MPLSPVSQYTISSISRGATPQSSGPAAVAPQQGALRTSRAPNTTGVVTRPGAGLQTADVTACGYRVGRFMADRARFATAADIRRKVAVGEVFAYWPLAKVAIELGISERQVQRGVRSLRKSGLLDVRRRVRPCEASYVFAWSDPAVIPRQPESKKGQCVGSGVGSYVGSGVGSGVGSHTEPRKNHERTEIEPSVKRRARATCPNCQNNFPTYDNRICYRCGWDVDEAQAALNAQDQRRQAAQERKHDPPPMSPEQVDEKEAELIAQGWRKEGATQRWTKF